MVCKVGSKPCLHTAVNAVHGSRGTRWACAFLPAVAAVQFRPVKLNNGSQQCLHCCRYYHPSPPHRTVKNERTFEGISLDNPGQSSNRVLPLSRFQLCATCYQREQAGGDLQSVRVCLLGSRALLALKHNQGAKAASKSQAEVVLQQA